MEALGGLLEASWRPLGSWGPLGPSWGERLPRPVRVPFLGPLLELSKERLGGVLGHLGAIFGRPGAFFWAPLGLPLGPSWGPTIQKREDSETL